MTVATTARIDRYTGNAVTTTFAVNFQFYQLAVYVDGTLKTQGSHYLLKRGGVTVADGGGFSSNSVEFQVGHVPGSNAKIVLLGTTTIEQTVNYRDFDDNPADLYEKSLDQLAMMVREIVESVTRTAIRAPNYHVDVGALSFSANPETFLYINEDGEPELADIDGATSPFYDQVQAAATSAAAAAASAVTAAAYASQLIGTSVTSVAIGTGSKAFATQSGKFFAPGTFLLITSDANPANYMHGQSTAYDGSTVTVNVARIGGAGTLADWTIRVSGAQGAPGVGDLIAANNLSDVQSAATSRDNLGLEIGADVQAYDADLAAIAALSTAAYGRSLLTLANSTALAAEVDGFFLTPAEGNAAYQALDSDLTAIAALTTASYGRALLELASEAAFKAAVNLEIGIDVQAYDADLATWAGLTPSANAQSLVTAADYAAMRALLDLEIGTDVQAYDADLAALAGLTSAADKVPYFTGAATAAVATLTAFARTLLDDADAATARATLELAATTTDNALSRYDSTAGKTQNSGVICDDSNNLSGIVNAALTGYIDLAEIAAPSDPAANTARLYSKDSGGLSKLFFRDSAGNETEIGSGGGGSATKTSLASGSLPAAATLDITDIAATYSYLILRLTGISSNTATRHPRIQVDTDNGASFDTTVGNYNGAEATLAYILADQTAATTWTITLYIFGYQGGSAPVAYAWVTVGGASAATSIIGYSGSTAAINALRILWSGSGNFDAGTYELFGIASGS